MPQRCLVEDVGVTVPGVGEVFYIGNPGYGYAAYPQQLTCGGCAPGSPTNPRTTLPEFARSEAMLNIRLEGIEPPLSLAKVPFMT